MSYTISDNKNLASGSNIQSLSAFEYFFVFMLIIYAGRANNFVESGSFQENPVGVFLPLILCIVLIFKWKIKFDLNFLYLIIGFGIYFFAISVKDGELHPTFFLTFFIKFFILYTALKALESNLFKIYEHILYYLAIIGLFMWTIQTILGGDTLFSYLYMIPGMDTFTYVTGKGANIILYSVQPEIHSKVTFMIPRNCGFAQEPGSFGVYLCLAIFINLFVNNSEKSNKKRFWVLVIALLSTQSTTGYVIFILIMLFNILSKNLSKVLLLFPFAIMLMIYISTLPFMSNKIVDLLNETNTMDQLILNSVNLGRGPGAGIEETYTPQRFTSFMLTYKDFKANPLLGIGPDNEKSWINVIGARLSPISGIGNLLAQFGLVGFIFFIVASLRSSFYFSKLYNYNGKFLVFFIVLFISVSYSVIMLPLLMCFWLFYLFAPKKNDLEEVTVLATTTQDVPEYE
jgi:hypothetical protein